MKNVKKVILLLALGIASLAVFQFCKDSIVDDPKEKEFANPYEFVGDYHNEGLKYVLERTEKSKGPNLSLEGISDLSTTFIFSKQELGLKIIDDQKFKQSQSLLITELESKSNAIDTLTIFQKGTLANKYYSKLNSLFEGIKVVDTAAIFKSIKRLENEIWTSKIRDNEKAELLIMSTVGRHSYCFWIENLPKYKRSERTKSYENPDLAEMLLKADMEGGLIGFICGAIAGGIGGTALMPGVGTLTAAIVSGVYDAVLGAIVNSVYRFVMDYILPLIISNHNQVFQKNIAQVSSLISNINESKNMNFKIVF
jgi:hypothetical protein